MMIIKLNFASKCILITSIKVEIVSLSPRWASQCGLCSHLCDYVPLHSRKFTHVLTLKFPGPRIFSSAFIIYSCILPSKNSHNHASGCTCREDRVCWCECPKNHDQQRGSRAWAKDGIRLALSSEQRGRHGHCIPAKCGLIPPRAFSFGRSASSITLASRRQVAISGKCVAESNAGKVKQY